MGQIRANGSKYPIGRYLKAKCEAAIGVTPQQHQEALYTYVADKFVDICSKGTQRYEEERRARITASLGRIIKKEGQL